MQLPVGTAASMLPPVPPPLPAIPGSRGAAAVAIAAATATIATGGTGVPPGVLRCSGTVDVRCGGGGVRQVLDGRVASTTGTVRVCVVGVVVVITHHDVGRHSCCGCSGRCRHAATSASTLPARRGRGPGTCANS